VAVGWHDWQDGTGISPNEEMVSPISKRIKMTKKVGNVRKRMLTRERILLIVEYLNRPEKQKEWTNEIRAAWHDWLGHLDENVTRLYYQLRYMVWKPRAFIVFDKKENNKHRVIYASRPEELIVDVLYFDCLQYVFMEKKRIIPANSYGSIKGKGQHDMRREIIRKVRHRPDLFVGTGDTAKFYPTANHEVLLKTLAEHIKDKWLLWLSEVNLSRMGSVGMALGLPSSNVLGHVYHAATDWQLLLAYKIRRYYRFCDDKYMIHKDVNYLHTAMRVLRASVEDDMKQTLKANWRVLNVEKERFECLGAMVNSRRAWLRRVSRRRVEAMMKTRIREGWNPEKAMQSWAGVSGSLRDLDVANLINYWKRKYPEFFDMLAAGRAEVKRRHRQKAWHNKLEKILTTAPDFRSPEHKAQYPLYGLIDIEGAKDTKAPVFRKARLLRPAALQAAADLPF
jgi:hypothetical protein